MLVNMFQEGLCLPVQLPRRNELARQGEQNTFFNLKMPPEKPDIVLCMLDRFETADGSPSLPVLSSRSHGESHSLDPLVLRQYDRHRARSVGTIAFGHRMGEQLLLLLMAVAFDKPTIELSRFTEESGLDAINGMGTQDQRLHRIEQRPE